MKPAACLFLLLVPLLPLRAQLSDPIPVSITYGEWTVALEDWVTLPASAGGGGGRARLSVMRFLPDGRLFVNDQRGLIYRIQKGDAQAYFDVRAALPDFIDQPGLGTGLHSFAFHPAFLTNGKLYTVHSEPWNAGIADLKGPVAEVGAGGQMSVVSEWTADDPSAATFSGTRRELLRIYFPGTIHCAQEIAFNPNAAPSDEDYGLLSICLGDGGGYLKGLWQNEQRLDSPMGTVLRIDPLGSDSANGHYGIPPTNPWASSTDPDVLREIYALGFRNPHRINWDTGGTGRAYVGDIGETQVEELNLLEAGRDYGFPQREGTFRLDPTRPNENTSVYPLPSDDAVHGYTYPVAQYDHDEGQAIVGGPVYRGTLAPALAGKVLFGDIVRGRIFLVEESSLAFGAQAPIEEVRLTLGGVAGTLPTFVGNSRADLRWGMDADGEVYVMTKTDGKIRRIIGATSAQDGFDNDPAHWQPVDDFEDPGVPLVPVLAGEGTTIERLADPFGDARNQVLAIAGSNGAVSWALDPALPSDLGSFYFRFAFADAQSSAIFGLGEADSVYQMTAVGILNGAGGAVLFDGASATTVTTALRPGIWYEAWIVFTGEADAYNLYLRGDQWTAPSLLAASAGTARPTGAGLPRFLWQTASGTSPSGTLYLDDLQFDPTAANLSSPVQPSWMLVSNFEYTGTLLDWRYAEAGATIWSVLPGGSASIETELSGNRFLRVSALPFSSELSHARIPLPRHLEVSETFTLYARMRVEDFATNQVWGLVNVPEPSILDERFDAFDVIGRWTDENGPHQLLVRDDLNYVPASGAYEADRWFETWLVVRNGGEASGGQTFDLYARAEGSTAAPTKVYSDAGFRLARETPITQFQIIANNGLAGRTGGIRYDDLFLAPGEVLEAPAGTGYGLLPGPRGRKSLPWFGTLYDQAYPWVYHLDHGWIYFASQDPAGTWFYDRTLGWLWVNPQHYPYLWSANRAEWLFFLRTTRNPRWFYAFTSAEWLSAPRG